MDVLRSRLHRSPKTTVDRSGNSFIRDALARKLVVQTRKGMKIQADVKAINATTKVMTETGSLLAHDQVMVEMKNSVINMDSPLMVMESNKPIGIMWASGISDQGYTTGIVQLIR